jgi:signal transduction histidine kinase/ActR/RegA family two-component response regulator/predicted RNA-binding protein with RPS1 domain
MNCHVLDILLQHIYPHAIDKLWLTGGKPCFLISVRLMMIPEKAKVSTSTEKQYIVVTVEKLLPYGVFVRLENGKRGYIRRREMSWEGNLDPRRLVQENQKLEAVVFDHVEHHGNIELSHKLTLPDPWDKFMATYQRGDVIEGSVKDIRSNGIFVTILTGLNGFIPLAQLARWDIYDPSALFWIDDRVEAIITRISITKRTVRLSIRRRMEREKIVHSIMDRVGSSEVIEPDTEILPPALSNGKEAEGGINFAVDSKLIERVGSILVVEDGNDLRNSFVQWLRDQGFQVFGASDVATAVKQIKKDCYGVCFVDLDLPDGDGLDFIGRLREAGHESHVIVMSSAEWMAERAQEIEKAGVLTVLFKPLDLDEIGSLLTQIGRGKSHTDLWQGRLTPKVASTINSFQNLADMMQNGRSFEQRLYEGLKRAFELTEAEIGLIFYLDPTSQTISVEAQVGRAYLNDDALFSLIESPVKDVLREGEPVFETAVSKTAQRRFCKLLDYLPFESCIGVPLGDGIHNDYALFLFHRSQNAFHRYRLRDAQSVAALLSVALERRALERRVQAISSILLSGQLSAGFGHEVSNKISAMEIQLRNLQNMCAKLDEDSPQAKWQETLVKAKEGQNGIMETAVDLKKTVHLFQTLTNSHQTYGIDITQVIKDTQFLLQPILSRSNTQLILDLAADLPLVPGSVMRLKQVILNIMLNAAQNMTTSANKVRRMQVTTTIVTDQEDARPLKVRIIDTGTGIHKKLWKKVFDLGFSTREDGTGLGLFIARSLAESIGGYVFIEQSLIPIGTTFVIELPITKEGGS